MITHDVRTFDQPILNYSFEVVVHRYTVKGFEIVANTVASVTKHFIFGDQKF